MPFATSAAMHIGSQHEVYSRNNQDSWHAIRARDLIVAGVADGCGAGRRTEVGSCLGVTYLVNNAAKMLHAKGYVNWGELLYAYNQYVIGLVNALVPKSEQRFDQLVSRFFMHTALLAILYEGYGGYAEFVRFGDGYVYVNGKILFPPEKQNNFPLVPTDLIWHPELWQRIYENHSCSLADVSSFLLATDGFAGIVANQKEQLPGRTELVGDISQLWTDPKFTANPGELGRYLRRVGATNPPPGSQLTSEPGHLKDDTTLFLAVRTP